MVSKLRNHENLLCSSAPCKMLVNTESDKNRFSYSIWIRTQSRMLTGTLCRVGDYTRGVIQDHYVPTRLHSIVSHCNALLSPAVVESHFCSVFVSASKSVCVAHWLIHFRLVSDILYGNHIMGKNVFWQFVSGNRHTNNNLSQLRYPCVMTTCYCYLNKLCVRVGNTVL